jgi:signal transduction histidine kinase
VPLVAVAIAVLAAITQPASATELLLLGAGVAPFVLWERRPSLPAPLLTVAVLTPVVLAQLSGRIEPVMFLVSLLAIAVAGWEKSPWLAGACCLAATATPAMIAALQPAVDRIGWGIWLIGVAFPALVGRGVYLQEQLTAQLELGRRQLALQAQAEERRRIARDIHDLVGHGLAGVLLQVTSARHVLRRDIDAADEALAAAEAAGRRSLQELRGTVAVLRSADESTSTLLLPGLAEIAALVDSARDGGLVVEYRSTGDVEGVSPAVGLALYRIAQEALLNAARHAPQAATVVATAVTGRSVTLEVHSVGPLATRSDDDRPRYGLIGMRERAATVGGELEAGPTSDGWRVCCRVAVTSP